MAQRTAPSRARQAEAAFEAHQAMLLTEIRFPSLASNPAWQILRDDAYAQFEFAFVRVDTK